MIRQTDERQKHKIENSIQISERYLKKLNSPKCLTGEQIWKLFKGDGSGEEISIDFIKKYFNSKNILLDLNSFEKILLAENEKSLKNMKNTRSDNTVFIELASRIKDLPKTDNSFKYEFDLDPEKQEAKFKIEKLNSKILCLALKESNEKFELTNQIKQNQDCILILDKTNFYPQSGGQQSDKGFIFKNKNPIFQVENVVHLKGYSFHIGKSLGELNVNDLVECLVDKSLRYETTLNHSAVHLLNHSIRKHYKNENSILQTNSLVKNNSFKFEFKFNEIISKPSLNDLQKIQFICNDLVQKSIPIFIQDKVSIENENEFNFPLRKLNDILYPRKLRIVSIGSNWNGFLHKENNQKNEDFSAELCCGTHATNTGQLKQILLTSFNIIGDSSFEIEGTTSEHAREAQENDKMVLKYLNEMIEMYKQKSLNESSLNTWEIHNYLNQIADRSIQIENIFKTKITSYLTMQHVKTESSKYRPSKSVLQNSLRKYFEEELAENSKNPQTVFSFLPLIQIKMCK